MLRVEPYLSRVGTSVPCCNAGQSCRVDKDLHGDMGLGAGSWGFGAKMSAKLLLLLRPGIDFVTVLPHDAQINKHPFSDPFSILLFRLD